MTEPNVTVQPQASVAAEVNAPPQVTMYLDGIPIQVAPENVPQMQGRGAMIYGPDDLKRLPDEVQQLSGQLADAVRRFVDGTVQQGAVSTHEGSESFVVQQTATRLLAKVNDIITIAHINFPVVEAGEDEDARLDRLAHDAAYHGWGKNELMHRYGLTSEQADQVQAREVSFQPRGEPIAQLYQLDEDQKIVRDEEGKPILGEVMPLAQVPADLRNAAIHSITTAVPEAPEAPQVPAAPAGPQGGQP